jgi:hypothetical protein
MVIKLFNTNGTAPNSSLVHEQGVSLYSRTARGTANKITAERRSAPRQNQLYGGSYSEWKCMYFCLFTDLFTYVFTLFTYLCIYLIIYLFIYLLMYLRIYLLTCLFASLSINLLKTERKQLYLKTQSVPRCKHFSSQL